MKKYGTIIAATAVALIISGLAQARSVVTTDISVPNGYKIEAAVKDLAAPTMVAFDDQGRMLIAESGYDATGAKVTRVEWDGTKKTLLTGDKLGAELPITAVAFHEGKVYVVHGGTVSTINDDQTVTTVLGGIPHGDHQANQLVFKDGYAYLSVGTVTNSAVVGPDNAVFGWLKDPANHAVHDVPCTDLELAGLTFESEDVISETGQTVKTGAYSAFGTAADSVTGNEKCNGSILRFRPDGSELSVYAWGFRNPYGLEIGPNNKIYASMHGFDARGSRPIENAWDCLYQVQEGAWYGWPDFACEVPVTANQFKVKDQPAPGFLIKNHPTETPPKPIAKFNPHAAINGFAFAPSEAWGKTTDAFVALFGDFTPATGTVSEPQGVKIVRVDTTNGQTSDFVTNKVAGQASRHNAGGLEHPSDVTFGPDGAMYIADWGVARVSEEGIKLEDNSGVIWKVSAANSNNSQAAVTSPSLLLKIALLAVLVAGTILVGYGKDKRALPVKLSLLQGTVAGIVAGLTTVLISVFALQLPWHTPPRVLATIPMGESALTNILEFKLLPTVVGVVVLLLLSLILAFGFNAVARTRSQWRVVLDSLLFGLAVWALVQYFVFPALFPLVTEKGFPPHWYAVTFGMLGLTLGLMRSRLTRS